MEIASAVVDAGLSIDSLAVDRFPFSAIDALRAQGFHLSDADAVFSTARRIKLAGEIEVMREAMSRVIDAADLMVERIEPERTENEIWADFIGPFIATEGKYVSRRACCRAVNAQFPLFPGGRRAPASQAGELLCFDTDAVGYAGYCVDFLAQLSVRRSKPATARAKVDLCHARAREQLEHNIDADPGPGRVYREIAARRLAGTRRRTRDSRYYCVAPRARHVRESIPNIPHHATRTCHTRSTATLEAGMVLVCRELHRLRPFTQSGRSSWKTSCWSPHTGVERMSASAPVDERLLGRLFNQRVCSS